MIEKYVIALVVVVFSTSTGMAQDARAVIDSASRAMGADRLNSIEYSGMGADFAPGQAMIAGGPWPKFINRTFTRTINYQAPAMRTQRVRIQGEYPQNGGGGQPLIGEENQSQVIVVGPNTNWNQQLEFVMTPHGFLKAAAAANPPATVSNQTVAGKRYRVVSFIGQNKARINGYINDQNLVEKVETWIDNNILGDMLWDATFTQYMNFGGVQFPRRTMHRQGGWPTLDWMAMDVKPNAPAAIQSPAPPAGGGGGGGGQQVQAATSRQLGPGVWLILPSYASIAVEFRDHIVIVGGGQNQARAEATIAEAKRLIPNKPIRYVINTHSHFDHSGHLRTYAAEGVTIITHENNRAFFERAFNAPRTLNPDRLAQSRRRATFETVGDKRVLTDGNQVIELYKQQGNFHQDGLIFAYLPREKVLLQGDMFLPPADPNFQTPAVINMNSVNLMDNIQRLGLDVQVHIPEHYPPDGRVVGMNEFYRWVGRSPGSTN